LIAKKIAGEIPRAGDVWTAHFPATAWTTGATKLMHIVCSKPGAEGLDARMPRRDSVGYGYGGAFTAATVCSPRESYGACGGSQREGVLTPQNWAKVIMRKPVVSKWGNYA